MGSSRSAGPGILANTARGGVVGALCCLMVGQPLLAAAPVPVKQTAPVGIGGDARVLHALNRFTFGPRPGDVAAVEKMGLDRWFERQLNPSGIDDSALDQRLSAFPAMRMSQTEMMERYPNPALIRQMAKQDLPLPSDPTERAIYADQIAFYKLREEAKAGNPGDPNAVATGKKGGGKALKPLAAMDGTTSDDAAVARGMAALSDGQMEAMDAAKAGAKAEAEGKDPLAIAPEEHVEMMYPEADARRVLGMGPDARVAAILQMKAPALVAFRRSLSKKELVELVAGLSPEQREVLAVLPGSLRVIGAETLQARMLRDVYSDRQLEAVMTDFWLNHFNVYEKKSQLEPYLIPAYEREVIRPRALGKFEDLLVATAKSPAMLVYLDNWRSTGPDSKAARMGNGLSALLQDFGQARMTPGLNENYGRELMELHTLGVGGGYTQADVTQVAKVFTGWTIERPYRGGTYQFAANRHEPGAKVVLGKTIPEGGEKEGLEVLHLLAMNPATARFISTKLAVRFVSDDPPASLVDRMTKAYLASGGDIKVVLRTMFQAPEFWSPLVYRAKVKTPLEFVVSAVRASDAEVKNALPLVQALDKLGMPLYGMQTPNGYSWKQDQWVSTGALVSRMNFALVLSGDRVNGVRTNWPGLLGESGVTAVGLGAESPEAVKERKLEGMLLGVAVSDRTRKTVLAQFNDEGMQGNAAKEFNLRAGEDGPGGRRTQAQGDAQAAGLAGLLLGSPEFQRR